MQTGNATCKFVKEGGQTGPGRVGPDLAGPGRAGPGRAEPGRAEPGVSRHDEHVNATHTERATRADPSTEKN